MGGERPGGHWAAPSLIPCRTAYRTPWRYTYEIPICPYTVGISALFCDGYSAATFLLVSALSSASRPPRTAAAPLKGHKMSFTDTDRPAHSLPLGSDEKGRGWRRRRQKRCGTKRHHITTAPPGPSNAPSAFYRLGAATIVRPLRFLCDNLYGQYICLYLAPRHRRLVHERWSHGAWGEF
jgi:hypothetical protein